MVIRKKREVATLMLAVMTMTTMMKIEDVSSHSFGLLLVALQKGLLAATRETMALEKDGMLSSMDINGCMMRGSKLMMTTTRARPA